MKELTNGDPVPPLPGIDHHPPSLYCTREKILLGICAKHSTCLIKDTLFHGCSLAW
jgi:hypothetical protein